MELYQNLMKQCIELARLGVGQTSPNPLVGCVIIDDENNIVSTGFHKKYGEFHAERDALNKLDNANNCTLIVNLEPCCHYGKTPPCTDIIINKGIKMVIYGMKDPNPLVSGKGIDILKGAGIDVVGPVLENECKKLNEIFIKNKSQNKTFVAIKTATTIDGKIATYCGNSKWITSDNARNRAKELRSFYDAILTSSATVIADNPEMKHKNKIILDKDLKTDLNSKIYNEGNIFVFCKSPEILKNGNISFIKTPLKNDMLDIEFVLNTIFELGIMSVFVEAGGTLCGNMLPYADKLYHFTAPKILADNSAKACFDGSVKENISQCTSLLYECTEILSPDILNVYSVKPL